MRKTKRFDSVKLMREARDRLSKKLAPMTPAEKIEFVKSASASLLGQSKGKVEAAESEASKRTSQNVEFLENLTREEFLKEVKARLQALFGERLHAVILYGSEARGEARPDSDIDLMIVLDEDRDEDSWAAGDALYPLQCSYQNRVYSLWLVSKSNFEAQEFELYRAAKREGIVL